MRALLDLAGDIGLFLVVIMCWQASRRALRGAICTYMTVELEADSHDLYRIFGPSVTAELRALVRDGLLERVEGLPVKRRGWRPEVRYFWLSRAQRAERAGSDAVPRYRS